MDFHDPVSAASHLAGAAWALVAVLFLMRLARSAPLRVRLALAAYGVCLVSLYTASGLFHGLRHPSPEARGVWRTLDRSAIYGLVAGTGLPVMAAGLPGRRRVLFQSATVLAALAGVAALWLLPDPDYRLTIALYFVVGGIMLMPMRAYYRAYGGRGMAYLVAGVGAYTVGAVIEVAEWPTPWPGVVGPHEVLHVADLVGSAFHYVFLVKFVALAGRAVVIRPPICSTT